MENHNTSKTSKFRGIADVAAKRSPEFGEKLHVRVETDIQQTGRTGNDLIDQRGVQSVEEMLQAQVKAEEAKKEKDAE